MQCWSFLRIVVCDAIHCNDRQWQSTSVRRQITSYTSGTPTTFIYHLCLSDYIIVFSTSEDLQVLNVFARANVPFLLLQICVLLDNELSGQVQAILICKSVLLILPSKGYYKLPRQLLLWRNAGSLATWCCDTKERARQI